MPKASIHPKYTNSQIKELIMEHIHDKVDRRILFLRLVDGDTISEISGKVGLDYTTVWSHIQKGERELFSHLPG